MKLRIDSEMLKKLYKVFKTGKDGAVNAVFTALEAGHVTAEIFDGIKFIKAAFDAKVEVPGRLTFPAKYLNLFSLFEGEATISLAQKKIVIQDGIRAFNVPIVAAEEIGGIPEGTPAGSITVSLSELKGLIKKVMFATGSADDYSFDCIKFAFGDDIEAVGCDRRAVAIAKMPQGSPYKGSFLFPREGLDVISRLDGDMATLTIYASGMGISVEGEIMFDVYIPQRAGKFPAYKDLLGFQPKTMMICSQDELVSVLEDMKRISEEVAISFAVSNFAKQPPRFRAHDDKNAAAIRALKSDWEGEELKIKVNARMLALAIENLSGPISFGFSNFMAPFSVRSGEEFVAILSVYSSAEAN